MAGEESFVKNKVISNVSANIAQHGRNKKFNQNQNPPNSYSLRKGDKIIMHEVIEEARQRSLGRNGNSGNYNNRLIYQVCGKPKSR